MLIIQDTWSIHVINQFHSWRANSNNYVIVKEFLLVVSSLVENNGNCFSRLSYTYREISEEKHILLIDIDSTYKIILYGKDF